MTCILFGILFSLVGLLFSVSGLQSERHGIAVAGVILTTIVISLLLATLLVTAPIL